VREPKASRKERFHGLCARAGRRQREEHAVRIRKEKKMEREAKKRQQLSDAVGEAPVTSASVTVSCSTCQPLLCDALCTMSSLPVSFVQPAQFTALVADIFSGDETRAYEATSQFRKMLSSEKHPPIDAVMRLGVAPKCVARCGGCLAAACALPPSSPLCLALPDSLSSSAPTTTRSSSSRRRGPSRCALRAA
jgi:hypothetical protein